MAHYDPHRDETSSLHLLLELHRFLLQYTDEQIDGFLQRVAENPEISESSMSHLPSVVELKKQLTWTEWLTLPDAIRDLRAERDVAFDSDVHRHVSRIERERRLSDATVILNRCMTDGFLSVDLEYKILNISDVLPLTDYEKMKTGFVQRWAEDAINLRLDDEQSHAIAMTSGDIQVRARAGSGKTRVLIARALFLQMHCHVKPSEMILLAFNTNAAEEMKARLQTRLSADIPHVMTFHAMAHALVQPRETLIADDPRKEHYGISREVASTIDDLLTDDEHRSSVLRLMKQYCSADWRYFKTGGFQLPIDEYLSYRRSLKSESLKGDYIKSFGEKVIANILFEYGVNYKYEQGHLWNDVNYRPDFTIVRDRDLTVIIEYFGMAGDPSYDEQTRKKRKYWRERDGFVLLEYYPKDLEHGEMQFRRRLLTDLSHHGMSFRKLTEAEIFEQAESCWISSFVKIVTSFINRCRQRAIGADEVATSLESSKGTPVENEFLRIAAIAYSLYLDRLKAQDLEDFNGLIQRATVGIREGDTGFVRNEGRERGDVATIRFLLIDEFQDFSTPFWELVTAIRNVNPEAELFCVGDDWQAINSFAGSNLTYFQNFASYFRYSHTVELTTNYRSTKRIVQVGNALMSGLGSSSHSASDADGDVSVCFMDDFKPSAFERQLHKGDKATPAILRIVNFELERSHGVVLLSRTARQPWPNSAGASRRGVDSIEDLVAHIQDYLPSASSSDVSCSTVHSYKGRQGDAVILVDAIIDRFPLIHPHWIFERFFGVSPSSICADERRLFYVGLTRAVKSLYILTERDRKTPFMAEIGDQQGLKHLNWSNLPSVVMDGNDDVEIRVFRLPYANNSELKSQKFWWNDKLRCWCRLVPKEEAELEKWTDQPWHRDGVWIEARLGSGELFWSSGTTRGAEGNWRRSGGSWWRLAK